MNPARGSRPPPAIPDLALVKRIGQGSYGEVWLAQDETRAWRAVKLIFAEDFTEPLPLAREFDGLCRFERFSREHPALTDILRVGRFPGGIFYEMELADDFTGARQPDPATYAPHTLALERQLRGRLPAVECIGIGIKLAEGLDYLHGNGLRHRDLKPGNVIFAGGEPKLADPGLVGPADGGLNYLGTEGFVPPEGSRDISGDVYALGKVLYEISTGNDREAFADLPEHLKSEPDWKLTLKLWKVLCRTCDPASSKRFRSAAEFRAALEALLVPPPKPPVARWGVVGAGVVLAVAALIWWLLRPPREEQLMALLYSGAVPNRVGPDDSAPKMSLRLSRSPAELQDGDELITGRDLYSIAITSPEAGYLYVFQLDSAGQVNWLFPSNALCAESVGANPVFPVTTIRIPADTNVGLALNRQAGPERVYAVLAEQPWTELHRLLAQNRRFRPAFGADANELFRGAAGTKRLPDAVAGPALLQATNRTVIRRWFWHRN